MRIFGLVIAAVFAVASPFVARAASTNIGQNIFSLSATFQDGTQIGGTITVDKHSGRIIAANVKTLGNDPVEFGHVLKQGSLGYAYIFELTPSDSAFPAMIIGERGSPQSLIGFEGGPMGPKSDIYLGDGTVTVIDSGTFTLMSGPKTQL